MEKRKNIGCDAMSKFIETPNCLKVDSVFTFFSREANSKFYFPGESHPYWELVYVSKGNVGVTADDRIYMLSEGSLVLHKPMEFHRIWASEGTTPSYNVISFTASGSMISLLENKVVKCTDVMNMLLKEVFDGRFRAYDFKNDWVIDDIKNEHETFRCIKLLELALNDAAVCADVICPENSGDAKLFAKAVFFLSENLSNKVTLDELAEYCFVSLTKIKRVFTKYVGCGVSEYFNHMKINEARKLLYDGHSVSYVSDKMGFSNQFYFSSVFKKITGFTPTQYKKRKIF